MGMKNLSKKLEAAAEVLTDRLLDRTSEGDYFNANELAQSIHKLCSGIAELSYWVKEEPKPDSAPDASKGKPKTTFEWIPWWS